MGKRQPNNSQGHKEEHRQVITDILCHNPQETQELATRLAKQLQTGDVVAFFGELGSGKTFMIQSICHALETREHPTSPTFTLLQIYQTRSGIPIYHFDFYRLADISELDQLGIDEFLFGDGISLIEWADRIQAVLPRPRLEVHLQFVENNPQWRRIVIHRIHSDNR